MKRLPPLHCLQALETVALLRKLDRVDPSYGA